MAVADATPHLDAGLLLLADISGYTAFLDTVATAHPEMVLPVGPVPPAYQVMSSLLDIVVERIAPLFTLSEIEGDAVFAYALDQPLRLQGEGGVVGTIRSSYGAFRERIDEAMVVHKHDCQACVILPSLELKFILHHGNFVIQSIAGRARLLGPAVNLAHRLLKNSVTEATGRRAYVLVTEAAAAWLDLGPETGPPHVERYPDAGTVTGRVIELERSQGDAR